jgi:EAL domain-containing protein (putative c-di-GMP-specific phosphodiesterase class I)
VTAAPHDGAPCACRTAHRTLAVVTRGFDEHPELSLLSPDDAVLHRHLDTLEVPLGPGRRWAGLAELSAFLRATLGEARWRDLRAAWLAPGAPIDGQLVTLIHAEPLERMAQPEAAALVEMVEAGRLETWYQPIFWAGTMGLWGYECLLRGRTADGGLVGAGTLLGWAQGEHLTFLLDRAARETHLRNAGRAGVPRGVNFLVNFLPTAIYRPEFCLATTMRAAAEAGLDPDHIVFEVVETERVPDRERLRGILDFYRARGFKVALDDVGSGYSGLSLMADLTPDLIKIDRELVQRSVDSSFHREVCASLARLGHENGLLVLAEGVETEDEWRVMEELGCNLGQVYLFGRPAPDPAGRSALAPREGTPAG